MPKLRVLSGFEICLILQAHGFLEDRQRGSHIIMQLQLENSTVSVAVPNHKEVAIGTLRSIIRQSGLLRSDFEIE